MFCFSDSDWEGPPQEVFLPPVGGFLVIDPGVVRTPPLFVEITHPLCEVGSLATLSLNSTRGYNMRFFPPPLPVNLTGA